MLSSTSILLLATSISSAEATLRSSYNYWGLSFLSPSEQAFCLSNVTGNNFNSDTCYDVAACILASSTEYAKLGFASGTTLLTLIPTALTLIPTNAPDVEKAMSIGWAFALMAAFSGYITTGKGSNELAQKIDDAQMAGIVAQVHNEVQKRNEPSELVFVVRGPLRWFFYGLVVSGIGLLLYLSVKLGRETIVTWACNHEFLHAGWLLIRMFPYVFEAVLLRMLRLWLHRNPHAMRKWEGSQISSAWLLAKTIYGLSLLLGGLVILYGTSLLGSTNLIDGSVVIWEYLLLFPLLFCSMQMLLGVCEWDVNLKSTQDEPAELLNHIGIEI